MNIGIIGSRRRNQNKDFDSVYNTFVRFAFKNDVIVSGGCPRGGDMFAEMISKTNGHKIIIHKPEWSRYGKGAGIIRNTLIANDSDILIACVSEDRTGGTEDTIKKFLSKLDMTEDEAIDKGFLYLA